MTNPPLNRRELLPALTAGALAAGLAFAAPVQAAERHPHIRAAIRELKDARTELKEGEKIFGGHREKALEAVDHAITQLEKALEFAK